MRRRGVSAQSTCAKTAPLNVLKLGYVFMPYPFSSPGVCHRGLSEFCEKRHWLRPASSVWAGAALSDCPKAKSPATALTFLAMSPAQRTSCDHCSWLDGACESARPCRPVKSRSLEGSQFQKRHAV